MVFGWCSCACKVTQLAAFYRHHQLCKCNQHVIYYFDSVIIYSPIFVLFAMAVHLTSYAVAALSSDIR